MKSVADYIKEGRIKEVSRDPGKAEGLLQRSLTRMENTENQETTASNAFMVMENAYESIRECIQSLMALEGYKSEDHVAAIAWGAEEMELQRSEMNKLHKFRKLRNASRYEAEQITPQQAEEAAAFGRTFVDELSRTIEERLS